MTTPLSSREMEAIKSDVKQLKRALRADGSRWPICVRLDRCVSWMGRVTELEGGGKVGVDDRLIYGWIAANSLFGRWDLATGEPEPFSSSIRRLIDVLLKYDHARMVELVKAKHAALAEMFRDEGLTREFWSETGRPEEPRKQGRRGRLLLAPAEQDSTRRCLLEALKRVYIARCQLVHGAATYSSALNRPAIRTCSGFLGSFLMDSVRTIVNGAWEADWDNVCYPPPAARMKDRGQRRGD